MCVIDKEYRKLCGFSSQKKMINFLSEKDVPYDINYEYIKKLNAKLECIFIRLNKIYSFYNDTELQKFIKNNLNHVYDQMKEKNIIAKLTNQGRQIEKVYFNWMRGHLACNFFKYYIAKLFDINLSDIENTGSDDYTNIETFKRTAKADLQIKQQGATYYIEVQVSFQKMDDIKKSKFLHAKKILDEEKKHTILMHFNVYSGKVAVILLSKLEKNNIKWEKRNQMEGQEVFEIKESDFKPLLVDVQNIDTIDLQGLFND